MCKRIFADLAKKMDGFHQSTQATTRSQTLNDIKGARRTLFLTTAKPLDNQSCWVLRRFLFPPWRECELTPGLPQDQYMIIVISVPLELNG
jgi:hypothetical protein